MQVEGAFFCPGKRNKTGWGLRFPSESRGNEMK